MRMINVFTREADEKLRALRESCPLCAEFRYHCPEHQEEWLRLIFGPDSLEDVPYIAAARTDRLADYQGGAGFATHPRNEFRLRCVPAECVAKPLAWRIPCR